MMFLKNNAGKLNFLKCFRGSIVYNTKENALVTALTPADKNRRLLHTIQSYGKGLLGYIRSRVKSEADAEDILQDIWYQLTALVNAEPIEQTGAWLYRVAKNKIIDKHKKKSETLFDDSSTADEQGIYFKALLLTAETTPETEYLRQLFWERLFVALEELPQEQKQVFIWQEVEGIPFQEIAEQTGEKIQTLVSRKRYAVLHLRKQLRELYKEIMDF